MPWKLTKKGYVRSSSGTLRLPQAPSAFAKLPGLKVNTPKSVPPPKPKQAYEEIEFGKKEKKNLPQAWY